MIFVWGALGGLITYLVVFVLPTLIAAWKEGADSPPPFWRIALFLLIACAFIAVGGLAALWFGSDGDSSRTLMAYGMAGEGLLGGLAKTGPS